MWLTLYGKIFKVQGIHWWMALIRGREVEDIRPVVGIVPFVKTLERTSLAYAYACDRVCD